MPAFKKILVSCLMFFAMMNPVSAEDALHYNVVSIQASAEGELPNDKMQVMLRVEHEAKQSAVAADAVNRDTQWALSEARSYQDVTVTTRNYQTQPRWDKRHIIGWRVSQQLYLETKNFEQATRLLAILQQKLQVSSMAFVPTAEVRRQREDELTIEALAAFRNKAQLVTQAMQQSSYELVDLEVGKQASTVPIRHRAEAAMFSMDSVEKVAVQAGTSQLTIHANGRIQLR